MGAYVPDPTNATQPTTAQLAGNMAYELQAIKGRINSLVASGSNWSYVGSFRNKIKNGDFRVAQRGTSVTIPSGNSGYTLDQWSIYTSGAATVVTQGAGGVSTTSKAIFLAPAVGNSALELGHRIESYDCQNLAAGTPVTISGLYYVGALGVGFPAIGLYTPTVADAFGTVVSVSAVVNMAISPQIAGTWQFFSQTFTLSADASNGLKIVFGWAAGAPSQTIGFENIQLETGSQYTPFEYRPLSLEKSLCERYYQSFVYLGGVSTNTNALTFSVPTPVTMRSVPTVTNSAGGSGSGYASYYNGSGWASAQVTANTCGAISVYAGSVNMNYPYTGAALAYVGSIVISGTMSSEL